MITDINALFKKYVGTLPYNLMNHCDSAKIREYSENYWNVPGVGEPFYPFPISEWIKPQCAQGICVETPDSSEIWFDASIAEVYDYTLDIPGGVLVEELSPFFYQVAHFTNGTSTPQTFDTLEYTEKLIETSTTKVTHGCKTGAKLGQKFKIKVPFFGESETTMEISAEYNYSNEQTTTTTVEKTLRIPPQKVTVSPGKGVYVKASVAQGLIDSEDVNILVKLRGQCYKGNSYETVIYDIYPSLKAVSQGCTSSNWTQLTQNGITLDNPNVGMVFNGKGTLYATFPAAQYNVVLEEYDLETGFVTSSISQQYDLETNTLLSEEIM
ncbi:ETX/MTX2 family pore-forming toxin [Bacillus thuringiensis]|nr:ETX/MTX2 family pore-forming toxin [Bacillus thuringiensis]